VLVVVELTVEVEVVVNMVKIDVAVKVGVPVNVVVVVTMVVGAGVVTSTGPTLPVAGVLNHESSTIPDTISNRYVSVTACDLRLKTPTS
jgi:hypothetical protein